MRCSAGRYLTTHPKQCHQLCLFRFAALRWLVACCAYTIQHAICLHRSRVFHLPATTDTKFALRNWLQDKRFVFWDEFSPVEFAHKGVMSVTQFKKAPR